MLSMLLLAGCGSPSDPTEANIAKGVELALAEQDPACRITLVDDPLPGALRSAHPKGSNGFPLYWVGEDEKALQDRVVASTRDRFGPTRGRIYLSDLVADGVVTVSYTRQVLPDAGAPMTIATGVPAKELDGWTRLNRGYPVICHARSKLAGIESITEPVDTPTGRMVQVEYRYTIDEVAPLAVAKGYEQALRASVPADGVLARVALVATTEGWRPVTRR
jgi:hypothetical protein